MSGTDDIAAVLSGEAEGCCLAGKAEKLLRALPEASIDAMVTDPPAGIAFMGKCWDGDRGGRDRWIAWLAGILGEALRTLKPGAHAFIWALPRTSHWTGMAIEDAGFEIRDCAYYAFGTGFPKSLDVSKAIDEELYRRWLAERPHLGQQLRFLRRAFGPAVFGAYDRTLRRKAVAERVVIRGRPMR